MQLSAIIRKEFQLLSRDIHGLLLLFVMPIVFILIMSLAMKGDFDRRSGVQVDVLIDNQSGSDVSQEMLKSIASNQQFKLIDVGDIALSTDTGSVTAIAEQAVKNDDYSFLVVVPADAFVEEGVVAKVLVAPSTSKAMAQLFVVTLKQAAAQQHIRLSLKQLQEVSPELEDMDLLSDTNNLLQEGGLVSIRYFLLGDEISQAPTSVQQNVPAWLVFSMFFVVVPLANTLINEQQLGTLRRIRTMPVATWKLIIGKIIPYFLINLIQVALMLLVGVFLVPVLGGDQLTLGHSVWGLLLISMSLSLAALGYAMLIAVISRTTEQATTLGGAGNIILAAIGGIMVPSFVMPEFMRDLSVLSPMSWGLQGFLDIFLRNGGLADVWPEALLLFSLGISTLIIALLLLQRQSD